MNSIGTDSESGRKPDAQASGKDLTPAGDTPLPLGAYL